MPKKISPNERRQWLERYDSGESEASIAQNAHRDVRTVKKCIALTRRERDLHGARVELLKNALKQHHDRLLNTIKEVEPALVVPARDLWGTWQHDTIPSSPLALIGSTAIYEPGKGWKVTLATENKPEWGLIQEHLKGDPLWNSLNIWRKALAAYVDDRWKLETRCAQLLVEKTGYKLVDRSDKPPFLYAWTILDLVCQLVLNKSSIIEKAKNLEDMLVADTEDGVVWYNKKKLAEAPGAEEQCKENILTALDKTFELSEAEKIRVSYQELVVANINARKTVADILLMELVPGECRVCRRLGT